MPHAFIPEYENYCHQEKLPLKLLFMSDNVPEYLSFVNDYRSTAFVVCIVRKPLLFFNLWTISCFQKHCLKPTLRMADKAIEEKQLIGTETL